MADDAVLNDFHPCTAGWFRDSFDGPTAAQRKAWPAIRNGESTLLLAPTGSGKTLAAFLASIDRLMFTPRDSEADGVRVLYISPLKALGVDIDRNLRAPIAGLRAAAEREGVDAAPPTVAIRSGDTPPEERRQIQRQPPEVLITTPESLYLLLTSRASSILRTVETVIVDEIHVMAPTKRGAHLFLSLERLERLRRESDREAKPLQRIGLSATQRPLDEIARLLGGAEATADPDRAPVPRPVTIVDASEPKRLDILIETPVDDMARLGESTPPIGNASNGPSLPSIWAAIHPRLVELIRAHRSTMVFVNSRRLAERMAAAINEIAEEEIALAHHGSVAKDKRQAIEDQLKRGQLPAIVATSSLELGIDMGAVDLVVQVEAPPTIASGIQRIGRSGRGVDLLSKGVIFPKYRGDLLACAGAAGRMLGGKVEETRYPRNPLDLVAQQVVAMVSRGPITVDDLYATVRGAAPYAELSRTLFEEVLDLLAGRYPSDDFAELRARVNWDRQAGVVSPRRGTQRLAILNGGTIPDRGLYGVFLTGDGPDGSGGMRVGELDEEMVFETQPGDVFLLGASSWRVLEITKDRVLVAPAPGEPGKMPFWRGDGPGRPLEFGRAIGRLTRELSSLATDEANQRLQGEHRLDERAANNLVEYLRDQREAAVHAPTDKSIVVETFVDEIGDWRVCVLSTLGSRVHAPWAMTVAARLREQGHGEVDYSWTDDGMVFRLPETADPPEAAWFVPRSEDIEQQVTEQLGSTTLFAVRFRENAARALLLPKRQPNRRTPLWLQRRKSADLLQAAAKYPSFPILLETYRECLRDVFDLPGLVEVLRDIERSAIRVESVRTDAASPFASALLFDYVGNFMYEGDAPLAERRAQALALDHGKLRELLGGADLRELLDADAIDEVVLELQRLREPQARDADDVHDLLLSLGPLTAAELRQRCRAAEAEAGFDGWLHELLDARRVFELKVGGRACLAAAEDAGRLRDALGTNPPVGLPDAFLERVADPAGDLVSRFARTHGPFTTEEAAAALGLGPATVLPLLERLTNEGRLLAGEFLPKRRGREWCDQSVLRRIKRKSLAKLRQQVEAVAPESLAAFLPMWQGVTQPRRGLDGLLDVIEQLQGAPLPSQTLEQSILPARVEEYKPAMLDELCLAGEVVWQGLQGTGVGHGKVALYLTDRFPLLGRMPLPGEGDEDDPRLTAVRELLGQRGALRFEEIATQVGGFPNDVLGALWQLVWRGEATNDTLAPLRGSAPGNERRGRRNDRRRSGQRFRTRRQARLPGSEGRWSLLRAAGGTEQDPTERFTALANQLLARHGVLTREGISREEVPGGFANLYPVLKTMEESGKVLRGYFVEGLGGAQFALPGADELLRRAAGDEASAGLVLAATDPANAYGAALGWPTDEESTSRPQRVAGASVVLGEGRLLGYLGSGRQSLTTFLPADTREAEASAARLAETLAAESERRAPVLLTKIDGDPAAGSALAGPLEEAGFVRTNRGLLCRGAADRARKAKRVQGAEAEWPDESEWPELAPRPR